MGAACSHLDKHDDSPAPREKDAEPPKLHQRLFQRLQIMAPPASPPPPQPVVVGHVVQARATAVDTAQPGAPLVYGGADPSHVDAYFGDRAELVRRGGQLGFGHRLTQTAGAAERAAKALVDVVRFNDDAAYYARAAPLTSQFDGQKHGHFAGDHFLTNAALIKRTGLHKIARKMPKGAHLHIHFNSCLLPHVLLDIAAGKDNMFILSTKPLTSAQNLNLCEVQFEIKAAGDVTASNRGDLFAPGYRTEEDKKYMRFQDFMLRWDEERAAWEGDLTPFADLSHQQWLVSKLVFNDREAHDPYQTPAGAWEKFNGRTRMMKGLFNYETAYRTYTRKLLEDFVADGIQYAEVRPNFMQTNQIWLDDGSKRMSNSQTMEMVIQEFNAFQERSGNALHGLKVIYCTPRSFKAELVEAALNECLEFKADSRIGPFIAGFDLVGEEGMGKPLKDFIPQFLAFQQKCRERQLRIPFLFHCGETLDCGGDTDGNLYDALLLDSRRIGHGFALARKPYLIEQFKKRNICLEICPISNEVLGLTPRIGGHAMYELLANNVHCTVNSDNGTLFASTLSDDFYQVMVGSRDMDLHGWRQLVEWSIEHASMESEGERRALKALWQRKWDAFVAALNRALGGLERLEKREGEADEAFGARVAEYEDRMEAFLAAF